VTEREKPNALHDRDTISETAALAIQ
jgi:hypothetical protein